MVLELYHRQEAWAAALPRLEYAITIGFTSFLLLFSVSLLLQELTPLYAAMVGVTMAVVYYALDPRWPVNGRLCATADGEPPQGHASRHSFCFSVDPRPVSYVLPQNT